jgi:hypothetical protein
MQWFFLTLIRIFDRRVKWDRRGLSSLDAFRQKAVNHICLIGLGLAIVNGLSAIYFKR